MATGTFTNPFSVEAKEGSRRQFFRTASGRGDIITSNSALIDSMPVGGTGTYESRVHVPGFEKNADIDHVEATQNLSD